MYVTETAQVNGEIVPGKKAPPLLFMRDQNNFVTLLIDFSVTSLFTCIHRTWRTAPASTEYATCPSPVNTRT